MEVKMRYIVTPINPPFQPNIQEVAIIGTNRNMMIPNDIMSLAKMKTAAKAPKELKMIPNFTHRELISRLFSIMQALLITSSRHLECNMG
jgi:hypothetical protein